MSLIAQVSDLVSRAELTWIEREMKDRKNMDSMKNSGIFEKVDFPDGTGNTRQYTSLDVEKYAKIKKYGESAKTATFQQGYKKILTMLRFASDIPFEHEDIHQSKDPVINRKLKSMSDMIPDRVELMLAHHFSFSTATDYTNTEGDTVDVSMGDGFAMGYSAHTLNGSSTTYRTILSGNPQFSRGCLEALENLFRTQSYNELGQNISDKIKPNLILSTKDANTVNTIRILNLSTADPIQNNSGVINPAKGKYRHVANDNIGTDAEGIHTSTKAKYVFLIDVDYGSAYNAIQEAAHMLPPTLPENDSNRADRIIFGVRGSESSVIVDAKNIRMTKGDGSA